ncbi:hypothetical protein ACS0TY_004363 [Phlomoides rotata]
MDLDNRGDNELEEEELLALLYDLMNTFVSFLNMISAFFVLLESEIPTNVVEMRTRYSLGCLWALDGTYINVTVPVEDRAHYRNRKGDISVNILAICDINMNYVYVLTGGKGVQPIQEFCEMQSLGAMSFVYLKVFTLS